MARRKLVWGGEVILLLLCTFSKVSSEANVAWRKPTSQSSDFGGNWAASNVVDGCTESSAGCCTHTSGEGHKTAWWRVDLQQLMTINRIQIIYRTGSKQRFGGYQLYLSNTTDSPAQGVLCYEDQSINEADVQLNKEHQCPFVARYVTVYNYRNNPKRRFWYSNNAILELCEVMVFGCIVGRYGPGNDDCNNMCQGSCYGGNCNPKTGVCFYCETGKYGDFCNPDCPSNCKDNRCQKDGGDCFGMNRFTLNHNVFIIDN
ncbi:fucolectin-3-like [Argopecten irradians]|uniref:fucolectin-3-like n=1 Tax=Argopecten irradians TaxID=31199 RepID=UPI00371ADAD7